MLSAAWTNYDLSSLEIITFGSEAPDTRTSEQLAMAMPGVTLLQKYGTSEFGAPRSKTRKGNSDWIKLEGPNFSTKIIDDVLWVKASGTMLGYLNHEFPEQRNGWLCTGDRVEQDGEWLRILGRTSDLINVGGEKIFPAEVERCIEQMPQVLECSVSGETHELLGNIVVATIRLKQGAQLQRAKKRVRDHCAALLPRYAIPMKVDVTEVALINERGKRIRR
jgi:acyl-coenzyme A synthetase/AMP-(fatty) acid ligase